MKTWSNMILYGEIPTVLKKIQPLQWKLEAIGFCMVKTLLKKSQPFIYIRLLYMAFLKPAQVINSKQVKIVTIERIA
jgi:hypothetical protein